MLVYAALVPPREILDDLWSVVAPPVDEPQEQATRAGRLTGRRRPSASAVTATPPSALDVAPVAHAHLLICKFGNLALNDANQLTASLTRAATEWSSPRLRLHGYSTLESEEDPSVWVDLEGDIEALNDFARGIPDVAKRQGLFVDRRLFQPRVRIGSVSPTAHESELETVLAKLAAFETNAWWQTEFTLFSPVEHGADELPFKTVATIPLGPHVVH